MKEKDLIWQQKEEMLEYDRGVLDRVEAGTATDHETAAADEIRKGLNTKQRELLGLVRFPHILTHELLVKPNAVVGVHALSGGVDLTFQDNVEAYRGGIKDLALTAMRLFVSDIASQRYSVIQDWYMDNQSAAKQKRRKQAPTLCAYLQSAEKDKATNADSDEGLLGKGQPKDFSETIDENTWKLEHSGGVQQFLNKVNRCLFHKDLTPAYVPLHAERSFVHGQSKNRKTVVSFGVPIENPRGRTEALTWQKSYKFDKGVVGMMSQLDFDPSDLTFAVPNIGEEGDDDPYWDRTTVNLANTQFTHTLLHFSKLFLQNLGVDFADVARKLEMTTIPEEYLAYWNARTEPQKNKAVVRSPLVISEDENEFPEFFDMTMEHKHHNAFYSGNFPQGYNSVSESRRNLVKPRGGLDCVFWFMAMLSYEDLFKTQSNLQKFVDLLKEEEDAGCSNQRFSCSSEPSIFWEDPKRHDKGRVLKVVNCGDSKGDKERNLVRFIFRKKRERSVPISHVVGSIIGRVRDI